MQLGKNMLGRRHCMPGVVAALHEVMVEGTFPDGMYACRQDSSRG